MRFLYKGLALLPCIVPHVFAPLNSKNIDNFRKRYNVAKNVTSFDHKMLVFTNP